MGLHSHLKKVKAIWLSRATQGSITIDSLDAIAFAVKVATVVINGSPQATFSVQDEACQNGGRDEEERERKRKTRGSVNEQLEK